MNTNVTDMLTVGPYQPIAGLGYNTIRKMTGKYADLAVGDVVEMTYRDTPDAETLNGVERLRVASIAMVPWHAFEDSAIMHVEMNHGCWNSDTDFREAMANFYGDISDDDHFLVIYFD